MSSRPKIYHHIKFFFAYCPGNCGLWETCKICRLCRCHIWLIQTASRITPVGLDFISSHLISSPLSPLIYLISSDSRRGPKPTSSPPFSSLASPAGVSQVFLVCVPGQYAKKILYDDNLGLEDTVGHPVQKLACYGMRIANQKRI